LTHLLHEPPVPTTAAPRQRGLAAVWIGAATMLAVALAVRLWLLIGSRWLLEGDDALSALMALGILDGDRPLMLKNQTYAGAWEPYAMAASYLMLGVSRFSAKLPALVDSLALVGATWLLAREVAGRQAAWFAALLTAVPPVYVLVLNVKPWAPYTEVIVAGSVCLACAVRLGWPRRTQRDAAWSLGCGLAGGFGFWMHPLAVWYLAAAALTLLLRVRGRRGLLVVGGGLLGFVIGALPVWIYNLQTGGATVRFIRAGTQGQTADRWAVLQAWWTADLPRGAGLWHPWGPSPAELGALMVLVLGSAVVWAVLGRSRARLRPLDSLLLLLVLIPTLFTLSGFGGPILNPYGFDATGRYTSPVWATLAVVLAAALGTLWHRRRWLAVCGCLVPLAINLLGVLSIDPVAAFQSPYWDKLPADSSRLLATLRANQVEYVWLNHWAGQPLMLDARATGQHLVAYDWYDVQAGGIDRFPEYLHLVEQASKPAFVLVTEETRPALLDRLDELRVSYVVLREPPYAVVIPTSRTVHPSEVTAALDYRY
jgi:Dolichyl-phosphate-mannose-protein mannosyltransferase